MLTLSVDTSTQSGSVAILKNRKLLGEIYIDVKSTHSERLLSIIDYMLNVLKMDIKDIDLFVSGIGPGSFTGIRIGLSLLKGFANSLSKPLVGVSSIDALAAEYKGEGVFLSFIEGRADEIFYAVFERKDGVLNKISDYKCDKNNILNKFKNKIAIVKSENLVEHYELGNLYAHNFGILGLKQYLSNPSNFKNQNITPLYLKKSDAEINLKL